MIRKLHRRLTLLLTALTALVLGCALLVTWKLSEEQYQKSAEELFSSNFSSLCDRLADAASVTDVWLAEQEQGTNCVVFLQDNGAALHYAGVLNTPTPRSTLEVLALEMSALYLDFDAKDSKGAIVRQESHFTLQGHAGDTYSAAAALLPRGGNGAYLQVISLQNTAFRQQHRLWSALQYTGLWLAGCGLLMLISYWLTGKALAPTAQALRQQKEFIAAASHELRSPLAVIKTSLQALDENLTPERQDTLLHNALRETDRITRLTDDLLLLANGDLGNLPTHLEELAPDNLCIEVYDQFYLLAKKSRHPLTLRLPDETVPKIHADAERMQQLLAILLHNAMEHTPDGTPIELVLSVEKTAIKISVIDHGPGISDSAKTQIFERFYRGDASRSSKKNFGLGLSVAHELARLHRATLSIQDTPGGGASFTIQFPGT